MWFTSKRGTSAHPLISVDGKQLQDVEQQKYLGSYII